jgi:hypothetical protein
MILCLQAGRRLGSGENAGLREEDRRRWHSLLLCFRSGAAGILYFNPLILTPWSSCVFNFYGAGEDLECLLAEAGYDILAKAESSNGKRSLFTLTLCQPRAFKAGNDPTT